MSAHARKKRGSIRSQKKVIRTFLEPQFKPQNSNQDLKTAIAL
jgi:hypothetical protein